MANSTASVSNKWEEGDVLNHPINIADLLSNGSQFEVDRDFDDALYNDDIGFDEDDGETRDFDPNLLASPWHECFDDLRNKMIKIDDYIYKRQVKEGNPKFGTVPDLARVTIEYTFYEEFSTQSTDSTFMRGHPFTFYIGDGEVIIGLEMAVKTMLQGEESQFVISYKKLYGEMGCPPRIKPKSDLLYVIKLLKISDIGDLNALEKVSKEDENKYSIVFEAVKKVHKKAIDYVQLNNMKCSIKAYHNCINKLEMCHLANEGEEIEHKKYLIELYVELAMCYLKYDFPKKACNMFNQVRKITNINNHLKALQYEAKAMRMLSNFSSAKKNLIIAQKLEPENAEIAIDLKEIEKAIEMNEKNEKDFCKRAFGSLFKSNLNSKNEYIKNEFDLEMESKIKDFKNNLKIDKMPLPNGLTSTEINTIEKLAQEFDLKLSFDPLHKSRAIIKHNK